MEDIKELIKSFKEEDYFDSVNLHIHTNYSDGKADFQKIIEEAKQLNYKKIAICDHNTVDGHKQFSDDIVLKGVEFDCWCGYVFMHLLGYGIDIENKELNKFMAKTKKGTELDIIRIFATRDIKKLIKAIHNAGGIAVLAHPACCWALNLDKFVKKLISYGLDGIETYYPYRRHRRFIRFHTSEDVKKVADKYNLIKTGGTDCHKATLEEDKENLE